jgi:arylsulfatase A-like enzyme
MGRPRNIIVLVADSLRYDSVHTGGSGLRFLGSHGTAFTQARSGGCWTLPATASLFTGLMPHEHGADSQSRGIRKDIPTIAEKMRDAGYSTHQITANIATTEIFGLERGFDEVARIWNHVPAQHQKIHEVLVLVGKPRLRRKIFSPEFVAGKLSEDLDASKVWLQDTVDDVFNLARQRIAENERAHKPSFLFLNLMETHFPYHVGPTFETSSESFLGKIQEIASLFHLINQTWLTTDRQPISPKMMALLRQRQRIAWERLAPKIDAFVEEMHAQGNLVVFGSDHGDNFGEQGWVYHFSNVTDAGNRVPLWFLDPEDDAPRVVDTPVSSRDVYQSLLKRVGDPTATFDVVTEPDESYPVMQSCWYNNQGKTLQKFKFNQICILDGDTRWMRRRDEWFSAPVTREGAEVPFVRLAPGIDPLEEGGFLPERKRWLTKVLADFSAFSATVEG